MFVVLATAPNRKMFLTIVMEPAQILFFCKKHLLLATNTWPGKSFWSPALGKQGGVAVLVAEKTDFEIKQWKKDSSGRIISLLACLGSLRYNFINVYAPTNPRERKSFYETLHEYMFPGSHEFTFFR